MYSKIKQYRRRNKLSAKKFAEIVGTSRSNISMIEIGKRQPSLILAIKIAKVIGCSVEDLFFEEKCHKIGQ